MAMIRFATLAVCGLIAAGCSENRNSIYRTVEIEPGKGPSIVTGSKQRIITNIDIVNTSVPGQVLPKRIVCAEPSPDVAQGISQAIQAGIQASEGDGGAGGGAQFGFSSAAAVAQLGERLATIQLLRDQAYRACEAYANGSINATGYTILHSRLNKTMVTLLSSEMTAGAFGRSLAQIGGSAGTTSGDSAATAEAKEELRTAVADYETAKAGGDGDAIKTAEDAVVEKAVKLAATQAGAASTAASASAGKEGTLGQISGTRSTGVSGDLARIHRQFMDDNSFDTLLDACVTSLDYARFRIDDEKDGKEPGQKNGEPKPTESEKTLAQKMADATDDNPYVFTKAEMQKQLQDLTDSPFNLTCLYNVIPEAVKIAKKESAGKVNVQKIRATNEGILGVVEVVTFCAEENNKTTPGCKNLDKLLAVKAGS